MTIDSSMIQFKDRANADSSVYPISIQKAIVDKPDGDDLTTYITEYNISLHQKNAASGPRLGTSIFTLSEAIAQVPEEYKHGGLKLTFNSDMLGVNCVRNYVLDSSVWPGNVKSWYEEGSNAMVGYYTCTTSGGTAAKTVSDASGYVLSLGGSMKIKFTNKHTGNNTPTLNINGQGAKSIIYDGSICSSTNTWENGEIVECYYDGSVYQLNNVAGGGNFATGQKVRETGIDAEPTAGSDNLVKSEGIIKYAENRFSIKGNGSEYQISAYIRNLIPGKKYKLFIANPNYSHTSTPNGVYLFNINSYDENDVGIVLGGTLSPNQIPDYYEFVLPENSKYLRIGGRADEGVVVQYYIQMCQDYKSGECVADTEISDDLKTGKETNVLSAFAGTVLNSKLNGVTLEEKDTFECVGIPNKFVKGYDGSLDNTSEFIRYTEISIIGYNVIKFLGYKRTTPSSSGSSGYAFGHYENNNWVTDYSSFYPYDTSLTSNIPFEITENIPSGATHFRTMCSFGEDYIGGLLQGFYIKLQNDSNIKIFYHREYTRGVLGATGELDYNLNQGVSYSEIRIEGFTKVRFLGYKRNTPSGESATGYAFGHYTSNGVWVTDKSYFYPYDETLTGAIPVEIIEDIPENATCFRTMSSFSETNYLSGFYIYLQKGNDMKDIIGEINENITEIKTAVDEGKNKLVYKKITLDDANYILRQPGATGGSSTYAEGNRIRIIYYLEDKRVDFRNKKYKLQQPNGAGLNFGGFNFSGFSNPLGNITAVETFIENSDYRTDVIEGCFPEKFKCDYLRFIFKKSDNSNFTDAEMQQYLNDFVFEVEGFEEEVPTDTLKYYPLSDFVNGIYINGTGGKLNPNNNRVTTKDYLALPYDNVEFKVVLPEGMAAAFGYGNTGNIDRQLFYFFNGKDVIFPSGATHFVMCVGYFNGTTWIENAVSPEEINQMVKNKEIALLYKSNDIVERIDNENAYIEATLFKYKPIISILGQNVPRNIPCFAHGSDTHGDVIRWKNILDFSSHYNLDAVLNTGDNVAHSTQNGMSFVAKLANDYSIRTLITVGNHDTSDKPREGFRTDMNTNLYNEVIKDLCEKESNYYTLPSSSEYDEAPTYYYSDFANKKIRFIAMNLYENGAADPSNGNDGGYGRLSQKQINWLISTLKNTPIGYGILLGYHRAVAPVAPRQGYTKFWQEAFFSSDPASRWKLANVNDYPITQIIDAFINRAHLQTLFTQTILNNVVETIEIDADFTNVDASIEFIAHVFGHHHKDSVGYYYHPSDFTPQLNSTQLVLCVCQTTSKYSSSYGSWANVSDVARGYGNTEAQDSFNVYGIDRDAKTVRIARIGANISSDTLTMRDFMIIPYA